MNIFAVRTSPPVQLVKRQVGRMMCRSVKSFVFVATTGRSGSKTLYHLCKSIPGCAAFHEPLPEMKGEILRAYNRNDEQTMLKFFKNFKLPAIYKAALDHRWYIETNHTFIKCFADAAVEEFGERLKVIHMVRDRHEVARSWFNRGSIPGKGARGAWLLDPFAPRNLIKFSEIVAQDHCFQHDYFKCLWYWYEIEARTAQFIQNHPQVPVLHLKTEELNEVDVILPLFQKLFVDFDQNNQNILVKQIGSRVNSSKKVPQPPDDIEQSKIDEFDMLCQAAYSSSGLILMA
ncbi:MAG: hypothetical protein IGS50_12755 [Synechococcales cyanobacterium C42_A2020_086]|jgi:hypothetical protein|nr:hypothetical protein [Synechococcales cyanobacterium C42_A2020_086]